MSKLKLNFLLALAYLISTTQGSPAGEISNIHEALESRCGAAINFTILFSKELESSFGKHTRGDIEISGDDVLTGKQVATTDNVVVFENIQLEYISLTVLSKMSYNSHENIYHTEAFWELVLFNGTYSNRKNGESYDIRVVLVKVTEKGTAGFYVENNHLYRPILTADFSYRLKVIHICDTMGTEVVANIDEDLLATYIAAYFQNILAKILKQKLQERIDEP